MDNFTVTLRQGETLLDGALKAGVALAHDCGGKLACATCCVEVLDGGQSLSEATDDEVDMLERAGVAHDGARLACQVTGPGEAVIGIARSGVVTEAPAHGTLLPVTLTADAAQFLAVQLAKQFGSAGVRLAVEPAGARRLRFDNPNARQQCGCGESFATSPVR